MHVVPTHRPRRRPLGLEDSGIALPHEPTEHDHALLHEAAAVAAEYGVTATTVLLGGSTADEIVAHAESNDVDLIVIGSRGHGAVSERAPRQRGAGRAARGRAIRCSSSAAPCRRTRSPKQISRRRPCEPTADRRLRAAVGLPVRCAREPGRLDRLVVPAPVRLAVGLRPDPRRCRRALVDPARRRDRRSSRAGATSTARWCSRRRSRRRAGSVALTDALVVGHDERGHGLGADAVNAVMRRVVGVAGSVELVVDYAPRPEYAVGHADAAPVRRRRGGAHRDRRPGAVVVGAARRRGGHRVGALHPGAGRVGLVRAAVRRARRRNRRRVWTEPEIATGSTTPPRRGARGRGCTRTTRGRGRTSSSSAAACCTG